MVLDTESLQIPHMGSASPGSSVAQINALPSANLKLTITLNGTAYHSTGALPFDRNIGPRIIESGHFFQRADVTHLIFKSETGDTLPTDARFETSAWSDRLSFVLYAEPQQNTPDSATPPTNAQHWQKATMSIQLTNATGTLQQTAQHSQQGKVALVFDPITMEEIPSQPQVSITCKDHHTATPIPVIYDHELGWHQINLAAASAKNNPPHSGSQTQSALPSKGRNDNFQQLRFTITNTTDSEQAVPVLFAKDRHVSAVTGITAIIRDIHGNPTGIPVQLSKNWHRNFKTSHSGSWFRGISVITAPANSTTELELIIANSEWGGVPAASHAQLSLIGWGSNQLWEQSAIGAWGESICYEPDQAQASCLITDVRPLLLRPSAQSKPWKWTGNVGGGDYMKLFAPDGKRLYHATVRTHRHRQGPCLTGVTYEGNIDQKIHHSITTSISRTDDIVRGTYRIRMKVTQAIPFSRFVIFQIGADGYNMSPEKTFAAGDRSNGLIKEWATSPTKGTYTAPATPYSGNTPWFSLHHAEDTDSDHKNLSNRGLIIRSWKAKLGGKETPPHLAEYGGQRGQQVSPILDITPPAGTTELLPGDYVDAVIEYIVMPKKAAHYYGPNQELKKALQASENTWKMIAREATENSHHVQVQTGTLQHRFPDIRIKAHQNKAKLKFSGGLGYVPFTFTQLTSHSGYSLLINGKKLDQSIHGKDYWQTDYDQETSTWSITYNVPISGKDIQHIELVRSPTSP